jgi:ribonuclease D
VTRAGSPAAPAPLIERQDDLERLVERLAKEPLVAVDTEAASFHRHRDRVYLLQLSSRTETAIVDPLAVESLAPFGAMLADPAVEIVFHDADYDLRLLELEYGFRARNLFDTRIAAQLLNEPGIGLAALLEKHLGVRLDKKYQRADWSARPLSAEMLAYAASDTRHLAELRDILLTELERRGRLAWAREEFALLEGTRWNGGDEDEPAYLRMKGAKLLKGRSLAALRELFAWRDELASRLDRAAFRIMNNEPMLAVAKELPRDQAALKAIRGIGPDLIERRGREILAAVERAMALPESALPKVERPPRRAPDLELEARIDRLKAARNALALEPRFDLAPGVLCPNGTLEAIARANPQTLEDLARVGGIRKWQVNAIGKELLAASTAPATPAPASTATIRSPETP